MSHRLASATISASVWLASVLGCGAHARSQCQLATRDVFGTSNPVLLNTAWPGQYLVPGTLTHFQAQNPMSGWAVLAMSSLTASVPLGGGIVGTLLIEPTQAVTLLGFGANTHWTIDTPNGSSLLGSRFFFQSFHQQSSSFYASNGVDLRVGHYAAEVAITGIQSPPNLVGGSGPRPFVVSYENHGPAPATCLVDLALGGPGGTYGQATVSMQGYDAGQVTIWLPIPPAFGPGGTSVPFPVAASTPFFDCNPNNNQAVATAQVAVPYYDFHASLVSVPNLVHVPPFGTTMYYQIQVTNAGNVAAAVNLFTQINCSPGQGVYTCTVNAPIHFSGTVIPAGGAATFPVAYFVPGFTWHQTQWVKVEVTNDIFTAGNFDQEPVTFY